MQYELFIFFSGALSQSSPISGDSNSSFQAKESSSHFSLFSFLHTPKLVHMLIPLVLLSKYIFNSIRIQGGKGVCLWFCVY